ncbi:DUF6270 domain-containing protein [Isoptericola sp. F-RaC21]|uniref:DUF6270 domain-containing protein n=1 Tax=Isoptericola sp. F-RaC21 TaxID=3141452 RepID=UPI00315B67E0
MRVFIHGSCVSRDVVALLDSAGVELAFYSPRQSLVPIGRPIDGLQQHLDLSSTTSRFQRRAAEGTIRADMLEQLARHRSVSDLILWDLTDERLGVYEHRNTYVTRSLELMSVGLDAALARTARHIPFGSDEHFDLWSEGLQNWASKLQELGLEDRVVLLAPRWAARFDDGTPTPSSFGTSADKHAELARDYLAQARHVLPDLRTLGTTLETSAGRDHQWGPAPFHFSAATNAALAAEIRATILDPAQSFPPPRPAVIRASESEFVVHAPTSWADEFALYVYKRSHTGTERTIERISYQKQQAFNITIEQPGTYRFRVFHKRGSIKTTVDAELQVVAPNG